MARNTYVTVSALIFLIVAIGHSLRAALGLPMRIGDLTVPVWGSWIGAAAGLVLCIWAFRSRND